VLAPAAAARVRACLARRGHGAVYLEDGVPS
jgi:hypothetical protein